MDSREIERAVRRTSGYYFQDGIVEIFVGCLFAAIAALFFVEGFLEPPVPSLSAIGLPALILVGILVGRWTIPAVKERVTHPRTGFVEYPRPSRGRRLLAMITAALLGAAAVAVIGTVSAPGSWVAAVNGLGVASFLLFTGYRAGLGRFYAMACLSGVVGAAVSLADPGETLGTAFYFGVMGPIFIVGGAIVLRGYLRQAPKPAEA